MSAQEIIDRAKEIRQKLRYPPNAVKDPGIDLTRKSTAHKGSEPIPDPPIRKILGAEPVIPVPIELWSPTAFDDVLDAVSAHYGVSVAAIKSSSRRSHICFARFVVVHLAIKMKARKSLSSIARALYKDHTSILHARNRINAIIAGNSQVAAEVQMIEAYIETNNRLRCPVSAVNQSDMEVGRETGLQKQEICGLDRLSGPALDGQEAHQQG